MAGLVLEPVPSVLLLLSDSRLPAGAHAHSGGLEPAVAAGLVTGLAELEDFLVGRLATAGLVAAAFAAAATTAPHDAEQLDAELDARTPSAALRVASLTLGRALLRVGRRTWPAVPGSELPREAHQPVALGLCAHRAGLRPQDAATAAALGAVTGPASAAVRLLGLDPIAVSALLVALSPAIDTVASDAHSSVLACRHTWSELPAASAPMLDLLAADHVAADRRMFAS